MTRHAAKGRSQSTPLTQLAVQALPADDGTSLDPSSPAFGSGEPIPEVYGAEQQNISPPIHWKSGPEGTRSYTLIVQDPDAPSDSPFIHWVIYNIPANVHGLSEGVPRTPYLEEPDGALQGTNDRGSAGYFGPRPPKGDPAHKYHFQVFALDTPLDLNFNVSAVELVNAMKGHVLGTGSFIGTYQR